MSPDSLEDVVNVDTAETVEVPVDEKLTDAAMRLLIVTSQREASKAIGDENWEDKVRAITENVINNARSSEDVRTFVDASLVYDKNAVTEYIIKHGNCNDVLYEAMLNQVIDPTQLLMDYIEILEEAVPADIEVLVRNYIKLIPHLNIVALAEWAIETNRTNLMLDILVIYPLWTADLGELADDLIIQIIKEDKWTSLASVFMSYPGLIAHYDTFFNVSERLSSVKEGEEEEIKNYTRTVFTSNPLSTDVHLHYMHTLNNKLVNVTFTELAGEAFDIINSEEQITTDPSL